MQVECEYLEFLIKQNNNIFRKDKFKVIWFLKNKDYKSAVLEIIWLDLTNKKMIWRESQIGLTLKWFDSMSQVLLINLTWPWKL